MCAQRNKKRVQELTVLSLCAMVSITLQFEVILFISTYLLTAYYCQ